MNNKLKYILRNSWDIFPGINEFQLIKNVIRTRNSLFSEERSPSALKIMGRVLFTSVYFAYGFSVYATGSMNPKEWERQANESFNKIQEKIEYEHKIDSTYQTIFDNTKNLEDSLKISRENNIPYQLILNPLFKDKERIAKSVDSKIKD